MAIPPFLHRAAPAPMSLYIRAASAVSSVEQILLPRCHTATEMPLRFVHIQNHPGLGGQRRIDLGQALNNVCWCPIRNKKF